MAIIQLKTNKKFSHIIQLSDIHIRLTKRHDEYKEVFKKLYENILKSPESTAIFIIGDIVNSKIDLSPECVGLAADLFFNIASIRPTILVAGNHDTNLTNRNRMDSLSPIVSAINHPNLYYLKESGLYSFGNICINNYSVFDSSEKYIRGLDIPRIYRNKYEYFIALYHGTVDGSITDLGFKLSNPSITVNTFDHHDLALLGDIHKFQDMQIYEENISKPSIRYAGSLLQQNHAESIKGHGYSFWELESRKYSHVEIPNDYGFYSILLNKGIISTNLTDLPKKARVRFQLKNTMPTEVKSALLEVRKLTDVVESCYQKMDSGITLTRIPTTTGNVILGDINEKNYQVNLITDFLRNKLKITDQTIINDIITINEKVNNNIKRDDFVRNIKWIPIKFEWENMFSYSENNVIDFTKLKSIVGLFASNASGKSSIFSALTFCLFDKCEREYKAANIINIKKTTFKCKFEFEIDGKRYFIQRDGKSDKKGKVKVDVRFWTIENGQEKDLNGEQRKDTNETIREYLGSYDDFVLTTLSVQNGKNNASIIDMGDTDRKDLFAQFMGLSIFDRLYNEANESLKDCIHKLRVYKDDDYTQKLINYNNFLKQAEGLYNDENKSLTEITAEIENIRRDVLTDTKKLHKLDVEIPSISISENEKQRIQFKILNIGNDILKDEKEFKIIEERLVLIEPEILELENKNINKLKENHQNLLVQKKDLENKLETIKLNYNHDLQIYNKSQSIEYDYDCSFCVKNAGTIASDSKKAEERIIKLKENGLKLKSKHDNILTEINDLSWVVESDVKYQKLLRERNSLKDERLQFTDKLNISKKSLRLLEEEIKIHENNIEMYNKNRAVMKINEEINNQINEHKKKLSNSEFNLKNKNKIIMEINSKISVCKNQINEINTMIDKIKIIEQEHKLYEIYCHVVSRDGIPFDIITATVPEIQSEVNSILSQIVNFTAIFETDGKNIIPYISYEDKKWPMVLSSGFEKFALSLAIRVALINISNLPKSNFLVIDEGFGVLDAENLSSMNVLFDYLKTNFDFIMIISHLESMRDIVDKHVEIVKENGFSRVEYK